MLLYYRRHHINTSHEVRKGCRFYHNMVKGSIPKERVEVMSDAAVAIVACVLILDLTVEEFPTIETVKKHGSLTAALVHMSDAFIAYFFAYVLVSIQWYVNHTIIHLFHTIDTITLFLQKLFLAWTALVLQGTQFSMKYRQQKSGEAQQAIIIGSVVFLAASSCNLVMWFWGYYKKEKLLEVWAIRRGRVRKKGVYVLLKAVICPVWAALHQGDLRVYGG